MTKCLPHFVGLMFPCVVYLIIQGTRLTAQEEMLTWPQFRGPNGSGVSREGETPLTWSAKENVLWKIELPGPGASSPIIVGQRVFLTCYSGYLVPGQRGGTMEQLKLHLVCVDRDQGRILWNKEIAPRLPEQEKIRDDHGYASSTPVADSERVYAFFGKTGVFAFDFAGQQLWRAEVGEGLSGWGSAASPVLAGDLVIVNASVESESLVALDKKTGKVKWRAPGIKESWNTPLMVTVGENRKELVLAMLNQILSFDPENGRPRWRCATDIGWYMVPSLVANEGVIYCIGGRSGGALAVRAGGTGDVSGTHRIWTLNKGSNVSSPLYYDGHLYWMHENLGIAYCVEADSGKVVYEERINGSGQVYASPILVKGNLYYVSRSGRTFVVAAGPKFQLRAINDLADGSNFNASPAVAGKRLYLRSDRFLYCVGQK